MTKTIDTLTSKCIVELIEINTGSRVEITAQDKPTLARVINSMNLNNHGLQYQVISCRFHIVNESIWD